MPGVDDALRVDAGARAAILLGIFVLRIDIGEAGLDRVELVAPDAAVQHLEPARGRVELPARFLVLTSGIGNGKSSGPSIRIASCRPPP